MSDENKKNKNCNISKSPFIWGNDLWNIMHFVTTTYEPIPESFAKERKLQVNEYKHFFYNIVPNIVPCKKCKINYRNHLKIFPIQLETKKSLIKWLFNLHNQTNKLLGKQILPFSKFIQKIQKNQKDSFGDNAVNSFFRFVYYMQRNVNCDAQVNQHLSRFISFVFKYSPLNMNYIL